MPLRESTDSATRRDDSPDEEVPDADLIVR